MSHQSAQAKKEEKELEISIEEVVVEQTRDSKPDYVRVKYTDRDRKKVVGHTRVFILAD
ncbi:MAG TPA: hypothetical protein VFG91_13940 [Woeseiaceae bacterium]|nr:hypothetical protein [Woeseiaceae bacterium]